MILTVFFEREGRDLHHPMDPLPGVRVSETLGYTSNLSPCTGVCYCSIHM